MAHMGIAIIAGFGELANRRTVVFIKIEYLSSCLKGCMRYWKLNFSTRDLLFDISNWSFATGCTVSEHDHRGRSGEGREWGAPTN